MSEVVFLFEEFEEGGYTSKALGHSIFTEADTLESLEPRVRAAVRCHFEDTDRPALNWAFSGAAKFYGADD